MTKNLFLIVPFAFAVAGCGGSSTPTGITPTLDIDSPTNNATVNLSGGLGPQTVPVNFETNWNLKAPGMCGTDTNCGHIDVLVDSSSCNDSGKGYNVQAIVSPAQPDFGKCHMAKGQHTITLELHNDADALVKNPLGDAVNATVTVIAE